MAGDGDRRPGTALGRGRLILPSRETGGAGTWPWFGVSSDARFAIPPLEGASDQWRSRRLDCGVFEIEPIVAGRKPWTSAWEARLYTDSCAELRRYVDNPPPEARPPATAVAVGHLDALRRRPDPPAAELT